MKIVSISLFFNKNLDVIINPVWIDWQGVPRCSTKFISLNQGWTNEDLAKSIMEGIRISEKNEQEDPKAPYYWTLATGIKSFSTFSKKYKCISIDYVEKNNSYTITAEKRYKDGSYGIDADDVAHRVKTYPGRPSEETIADQVLDAYKIIE